MNGQVRQRRSIFPDLLIDTARDMYEAGMSAEKIAAELPIRLQTAETPGPRTIRNWARGWKRDLSATWTPMNGDAADAKAVLAVVRDLVPEIGAAAYSITQGEADVIARLTRIADDMPASTMRRWARRYVGTESGGVANPSLIAYLVHAPWRDAGESYRAAFDRGLIEELIALSPADRTWLPAERRRSGTFALGAWIATAPPKRGRPPKNKTPRLTP